MHGICGCINSHKDIYTSVAYGSSCVLPGETCGQYNVCQGITVGCGQTTGYSIGGIYFDDLGNFACLIVIATIVQTITTLLTYLHICRLNGGVPVAPYVVFARYDQGIQNTCNTIILNKCCIGIDCSVCEEVHVQRINDIVHILAILNNVHIGSDKGRNQIHHIVVDTCHNDLCIRCNCANLIQNRRELCGKVKIAIHCDLSDINQQALDGNCEFELQVSDYRLIQTFIQDFHHLGTQIQDIGFRHALLIQNGLEHGENLILSGKYLCIELAPLDLCSLRIQIHAVAVQDILQDGTVSGVLVDHLTNNAVIDDVCHSCCSLVINEGQELAVIKVNGNQVCVCCLIQFRQGKLCKLMCIQFQRCCQLCNISSIAKGNILGLAIGCISAVSSIVQSILQCHLNCINTVFCAVNAGSDGVHSNPNYYRHFCSNVLRSLGHSDNNLTCCSHNCNLISINCSLNCLNGCGCSCGNSLYRNIECSGRIGTDTTGSSRNNILNILSQVNDFNQVSANVVACDLINIFRNRAQSIQCGNCLIQNCLSLFQILDVLRAFQHSHQFINDVLCLCKACYQVILRAAHFKRLNLGENLICSSNNLCVCRLSQCHRLSLNYCDSGFCIRYDLQSRCLCSIRDRCDCSCSAYHNRADCLCYNNLNINGCLFYSNTSFLVTGNDGIDKCIHFHSGRVEEDICRRTIFNMLHQGCDLRHYFLIDLCQRHHGSLGIGNQRSSICRQSPGLLNDALNLFQSQFGFFIDLIYQILDIVDQRLQLVNVGLYLRQRCLQLFNFSINLIAGISLNGNNLCADIGCDTLQLAENILQFTQVDLGHIDAADHFIDLILNILLCITQELPDHLIDNIACQEAVFLGVCDDEVEQIT